MIKPEFTDIELWEAIKFDDKRAFDLLFERYWSAMYSSAYNYLRDAEKCREIVHDIFLNIWQKRKEYQITHIKNYLTTATRYHVYKCLRDRKTSALIYVKDYDDEAAINSVNEAEGKLACLDLEVTVEGRLHRLPKRCREIFVLSRMRQMTNDEIAIHFGISKRTVENQLTSALKHLREILQV
jgi:RNA polymerase sigma-70 factor (family 1)